MKKLLKLAGFYMLSKPTNMSTFIPVTTSSSSDRSSPSEAFLEKGAANCESMQQIYRRTPMLKCGFFCKFAAYFQDTLS